MSPARRSLVIVPSSAMYPVFPAAGLSPFQVSSGSKCSTSRPRSFRGDVESVVKTRAVVNVAMLRLFVMAVASWWADRRQEAIAYLVEENRILCVNEAEAAVVREIYVLRHHRRRRGASSRRHRRAP
jgi:hypothetical protein